jgi:hypothetical protein
VVRGDGSLYRSLYKGTDIDTTLEKAQEIAYKGRAINTCGEGLDTGAERVALNYKRASAGRHSETWLVE